MSEDTKPKENPCPEFDNLPELPDHEHDFTEAEYRTLLKFIDGDLCKEGLNETCRKFLKMRWLKAVLHLEYEAKRNDRRYFRSSIVVLIASAITTALTGANLTQTTETLPSIDHVNVTIGAILRSFIFILSLTITIIVGLMNLYKFDEVRWKKRIYAEKLKTEGFQFIYLTGPYKKMSYEYAYPYFADNVEKLIKEVNEGYTNLFTPSGKSSPDNSNPSYTQNQKL